MGVQFFPADNEVLSLWDIAETLIPSHDMRRPLDRICELMRKHDTKSVAIHYNIQKERYFSRTCTHLKKYLKDVNEFANLINVRQILFLSCSIDSLRKSNFPKTLKKENVLGMCIIVKLQFKSPVGQILSGEIVDFVYEAVLRFPAGQAEMTEPSGLPNNYYHVFSDILFYICNKKFSLLASYFCQSDGVEAVCAQASLRMALFHSELRLTDIPSYRTMNNIVKRQRRKIPWLASKTFNPFEGYYITDFETLLKSQNMKPLILECRKNPTVSPYEWAYLLVESGIPTLIVFSPSLKQAKQRRSLHVIPVVGHTTNYDEWLPPAHSFYKHFEGFSIFEQCRTFLPSSSWVSHLIVQDDLLGPYHCLGERDLITTRGWRKRALLKSRIEYVIGMVPTKSGFSISPYSAQWYAAHCFKRNWHRYLDFLPQPWQRRFKQREGPLANHKTLVLRTQLIGREDYLKHLTESRDYCQVKAKLSSAVQKKLLRKLPKKFWMSEFTCPQIYTVNRAKFGEVLIKFAPSKQEQNAFGKTKVSPIYLGLRFINHLRLEQRPIEVALGFKSHIGLFRRQRAAVEY